MPDKTPPTIREILKTLQAQTVVAKPETMYMSLIDQADAQINELLVRARLREEHYWIDDYSRQIKATDGGEDKAEKHRLKELRARHQQRAAALTEQLEKK
jgi:hypothetical protein